MTVPRRGVERAAFAHDLDHVEIAKRVRLVSVS